MIHFVGAGPGAPDLITVRGQKLLAEADVIIYAGSLVNPELLKAAGEGCRIYNSAYMALEEVLKVMEEAEREGLTTVRLHTGDGMEYTLPGISQSVILTRMEGRTKVPEKETIESFAAHQATMVLFLSSGMIGELAGKLVEGGYAPQTPAAIVYKATWPEEKVFVCTIDTLEKTAADNDIDRTALIIVGEAVRYNGAQPTAESGEGRSPQSRVMRSCLYDADYETGYRSAKPKE